MPPSKKTVTITLHVSVANMLREFYVGENKSYKTFSEAINNLIGNYGKLKNVIERQYHHLSFRAAGEDVFIVKDNAKQQTAEIVIEYDPRLRKHKLFCNLDESTNCEHVGFAVTRPEILRLQNIDRL